MGIGCSSWHDGTDVVGGAEICLARPVSGSKGY